MEEKQPPLKSAQPSKQQPKIQVLAEDTNFESMVVDRKSDGKLVEISIEIDSVDSMKELDLVISNKDIKLYRVGPERYTMFS